MNPTRCDRAGGLFDADLPMRHQTDFSNSTR
jgi:hypothetical protein